MKIEKDRRVRLKIKLQVEGGEVLEESVVEYFQGAGKMLLGLEEAIEGLEAGDKKSGTIPSDKAFGGETHQHKKTILRSEFPAGAEIEKGATFVAGGEAGQEVVLEIVEVGEKELTALLRHPLADKNIAFEAEILSVTDPAPPPLPSDALTDKDS